MLHELEGIGPGTNLLGDTVQLIVKNIAEAFGKDKREDELLIFRRILGPTNGTGSVPDPAFQGFTIFLISHNYISTLRDTCLIKEGGAEFPKILLRWGKKSTGLPKGWVEKQDG
jgi:hypothetical protein